MFKILKRVILLAILITFVQAAFWPWEGKEEKKKSKSSKKSRRSKEASGETYDVES